MPSILFMHGRRDSNPCSSMPRCHYYRVLIKKKTTSQQVIRCHHIFMVAWVCFRKGLMIPLSHRVLNVHPQCRIPSSLFLSRILLGCEPRSFSSNEMPLPTRPRPCINNTIYWRRERDLNPRTARSGRHLSKMVQSARLCHLSVYFYYVLNC